jgi:hypothetical protein
VIYTKETVLGIEVTDLEEGVWDQAKHDPSKPLDPMIVHLMRKLSARQPGDS